MPNWDGTEAAKPMGLVPEGDYLCEVATIKDDKETKYGDPMWGLTLEILEGPYRGRSIFDNLVFSDGAAPRVKGIFKQFGVDLRGSAMPVPSELIGKRAIVTAEQETYISRDGVTKRRNSVPYMGYQAVDGVTAAPMSTTVTEDDIVPF